MRFDFFYIYIDSARYRYAVSFFRAKRQREKEKYGRRRWSRNTVWARVEQLKDGSVAEGLYVTYVTQYARCRLCRAICPGASLARAGARIRRRDPPRYQKSGRVSAPALITARRRSYFTPRSSIIHAVNNAPLFRVTLYRGLFPSFLPPFVRPSLPRQPSFLPSFFVSSCRGARISQGSHPTRRGRGARCIRPARSYLHVYPPKRRHASVCSLARSLAVWPALYSTNSRRRFLSNSRREGGSQREGAYRILGTSFR